MRSRAIVIAAVFVVLVSVDDAYAGEETAKQASTGDEAGGAPAAAPAPAPAEPSLSPLGVAPPTGEQRKVIRIVPRDSSVDPSVGPLPDLTPLPGPEDDASGDAPKSASPPSDSKPPEWTPSPTEKTAPPDAAPTPASDSAAADPAREAPHEAVSPVTTTVEQRAPWLRTPQIVAFGSGAVGLVVLGAGIVNGLDARAAEAAYRRARTQVDAFDEKSHSERAGSRANTLFAVGGVIVAAAASTIVLDAFGVFRSDGAHASGAVSRIGIGILPGGAVAVWISALP